MHYDRNWDPHIACVRLFIALGRTNFNRGRSHLIFDGFVTRQHQPRSRHGSPRSQSNEHEPETYNVRYHLQRSARARRSSARCGRGIGSVLNIGRGTFSRGTSRQQ
ncbi:unnamed protein product [Ectocarpus fasciculatus]